MLNLCLYNVFKCKLIDDLLPEYGNAKNIPVLILMYATFHAML